MRMIVRAALAGALVMGTGIVAASAAPSPRGADPAALAPVKAKAPKLAKERPAHRGVHQADATEGTWTGTVREDGRVRVSLRWEEHSNWDRSLDRAELNGLTEGQTGAAASTPVAFRIEREAGAFEMEGSFREGRGAGHFRFRPDPAFASRLREAGVRGTEAMTPREQMLLAWAGASSATVREFAALGFPPLSVEQVLELAIHEVTPAYVRSLRSIGLEGTGTVHEVVEMRIHQISVEYVRELEGLGYRGLSRRQLLEMGIHGVDAEHVRQMRALGFGELTPRQLVDLRIHGVTPEYAAEMRQAGFGELTPEALVDLRIHGITARYIRELAELGYRDLPRQQLMQMGIHRVTPEFIREMREAGYDDLSAETLVRMRIHGIDAAFVRGARRSEN
jgi:hypothetical protein